MYQSEKQTANMRHKLNKQERPPKKKLIPTSESMQHRLPSINIHQAVMPVWRWEGTKRNRVCKRRWDMESCWLLNPPSCEVAVLVVSIVTIVYAVIVVWSDYMCRTTQRFFTSGYDTSQSITILIWKLHHDIAHLIAFHKMDRSHWSIERASLHIVLCYFHGSWQFWKRIFLTHTLLSRVALFRDIHHLCATAHTAALNNAPPPPTKSHFPVLFNRRRSWCVGAVIHQVKHISTACSNKHEYCIFWG